MAKTAMPEKKEAHGLVAVAIGKGKGSQNAIKWVIDNILHKGDTVILIHVKLLKSSPAPSILPSLSTPSMSLCPIPSQTFYLSIFS